jgi:hypothetical protein
MVTFITSIRHPHNSNDFAKVEALFEMSLKSVCAQTDPNFRVMVVANDVPRVTFKDSRVDYHVVDFPCPAPQRGPATGMTALARDKGTKLVAGMLAARQFKPAYFAIFDADDLMSNRIAGFVNTHPSEAGWYVDAGYIVNSRRWTTKRKSGLFRYCGSTLIPNAASLLRLGNIDDSVRTDLSQEQILQLASGSFVNHVVGNHPYMIGYLGSRGLQMRPLPFRAACWMLETGENYSVTVDVEDGLPITEAICREFGLSDVPPNPRHASLGVRCREFVGATVSSVGALKVRLTNGFPLPPTN